jgi:hypothetical protein
MRTFGDKRDTRERRLETYIHCRAGISRSGDAWLPVSGGSSPSGAREAAAVVACYPHFVANGEGRRQVGAARVLHRLGGLAVVAVSVGVAGGVPDRQSRRL